jgi:predicted DCC family thiol-disulfide oxidoreductase YuxK
MSLPIPPNVTVWYDSACPLCSREIAVMRRLDRRGAINFVDACDPDATCPIDRRDILARFHAAEGEQLLSGAAAFAAMWRAIPLLRPLGIVAGWPGFDRGFEWLYLRFLTVRPLLQRALQ